MATGVYGRQWISPLASLAFNPALLTADQLCINGHLQKSLELYRKEASHNHIARRRLSIARKQIRETLSFACNDKFDCLRIGFVDWYPGFESDKHIILNLFTSAGLTTSTCAPELSDIIIAGSYGNRLPNDLSLISDKLVIFFTGENLCPSFDIHDFSITTRSRSYCGKNARYPQWLTELDISTKSFKFRNIEQLDFKPPEQRDLMFSAIYNNSTPEREEILALLRSEFGNDNIHVYGSHRTGVINKFHILARSIFNVCFENSIGEGYVTEKLLHARMMGCKALYWGHDSFLRDFHPASTINFATCDSFSTVIQWCHSQLAKSSSPYTHTSHIDPRVFARLPSINYLTQKLNEWTKLIFAWRCLAISTNLN